MGGKGARATARGQDGTTPGGRRRVIRLAAAVAILAAGLAVGVAPVIGDGLNQKPLPASPLTPATVVASAPQALASGQNINRAGIAASARTSARRPQPLVLRSRITKVPLVTEEGTGTFVGVACPRGSRAISGGVISGFINLVMSSSSPNNPLSGKYTPQIWWLTVTNANIDGQGGSLSWRGVVNCLRPVALRK
jgi:hypothetical protein